MFHRSLPRSTVRLWICTLILIPLGTIQASEKPVAADHAQKMKAGTKLFKEQVRGILTQHCLECHGGKSIKGDFDLSSREALLESGMIGETAEESYMYSLITHAEEPHMPFKAAKLPENQIAAIARWIEFGAPFDKPLAEPKQGPPLAMQVSDSDRQFWSFLPLRTVAPPKVANEQWCRTDIDRFILARQEAQGLSPNPQAEKRTLIRRAYLDLLGLPPSPQEVEAFLSDRDERAYEKMIDRLLASKHYGERWARHWMDVARFAESHGYEQDYDRPYAYHYRDFLIRAFNDDMPFDQFTRWQLAGDELAPEEPMALMATGFLGAGAFPTQLTEAEFESARYDELDDMTATTGVAFLGLSIGCARCHDHKFDPIPSEDYYRLASAFTTTIRSEIELVLEPASDPVKVQVNSEGFPHMKHHADDRGYPHFYDKTYVLLRGDVHQKQKEAEQGFLQVLMRGGKTEDYWKAEPPSDWQRTSYRRTNLANWMTDTRYGAGALLARVIVNRVWQHHFGRGIVATPNDFGFQGDRPTHPELLEWLATDLVHHGWRLKRLHKLIMTSSVYMQSSAFDESRARVDRENQLYWRRTPVRLEAEAIRDSMLAVAGMLDKTMYGPGTLDQQMRRRSVYFFIKRSELIPMMMLFDWPEHLVSIGQRPVTTTAPQSLVFMNSPQGREFAKSFAKRIAELPREEQIQRAYMLAYCRPPSEPEVQISTKFLDSQQQLYESTNSEKAKEFALTDWCQMLLSANEFVYVD